jgi:hypothetical protein
MQFIWRFKHIETQWQFEEEYELQPSWNTKDDNGVT